MGTRSAKYYGQCSVCGEWTSFIDMAVSIRETYQCQICRASMRERVTGEALLAVYGHARAASIKELSVDSRFAQLDIFEPGISGAYRQYFSLLEGYKNSFYWEDLAAGELRDGVENQDLMNLTFPQESFDLVISSDIFEHIRRPWVAFSEIRRILRPGGVHVFSIPSLLPMSALSRSRVDTTTAEDIHIEEPRYHGDGKGGKSLVYTDFGSDLFDTLTEIGFRTISLRSDHVNFERSRVNVFISFAV